MIETATIVSSDGVWSVAGPLTYATVRAVFAQIQSHNAADLTLDLQAVTQCDSAALALLVECKRVVDRGHAHLVLRHAPAQLQALAEAHNVAALLH